MGKFSPITLAVDDVTHSVHVSSVNRTTQINLEKQISTYDTATVTWGHIPFPTDQLDSLKVVFNKVPSHKPGIFRYSIAVYSRDKECHEFLESCTNVYIDWTNTPQDAANLLIDVCKVLILETF